MDDSPAPAPVPRLGLVVPKRHARRSVTRNLVKRQVRAAWDLWWRDAHARRALQGAHWVVRLRGPIDRKQFISARSEPLAAVLRGELQGLFDLAARRALKAPPALNDPGRAS